MFQARDMSGDAEFCHQQAMRMMMRLTDNTQTSIAPEEALVATAIVSPEAQFGEDSSAVGVSASCLMLLASLLMALAF